MVEKRIEGVVLKTIPHKENDRVVTLLTLDSGVINLYVRGLSKKRTTLVNLTTPFCHGEFVIKKGKSDLYLFLDGTILNLHLPLRRSYRHLEVGGKMVQAILKTQLPGKNAPALCQMFLTFLKKLPDTCFPEGLWATFQLKLLKHEGLLAITPNCLLCTAPASQILNGESRCMECGSGLPFSKEDWKMLHALFKTRSLAPLLSVELPSSLLNGIDTCFRREIML
ncbi:MAG: DNA repair protein RecO [Chlamydiia bacterium]|nr:DNA repair protein RecO [Chlamydiia bacterium]